MCDWIYLAKDQDEQCVECGAKAMAIDGSGDCLCGDCLIVKYPLEKYQWLREV